MDKIAQKLRNTTPTLVDPVAYQLLEELVANVDNYVIYTSYLFNAKNAEKTFEDFVQLFLQTYAYVGEKGEQRLPSYDPFHIAYTEKHVHPEHGPSHKWIGWYSNCWIMWTEYIDHPERNVLLLAIDRETYNGAIKSLEQVPDD